MAPISKISVVLPTYDERENIRPLIAAISAELSGLDHEILVIDDDSPDLTWRVVEEIAQENAHVRLIRRRGERGLTSALNEGIRSARGDALIWMDCDFQHPVSLIPHLIETLNRGHDAALTSRYCAGAARDAMAPTGQPAMVRVHRLLTRLLNRAASCLLCRSITDWTSGYPAIRRSVFDDYQLQGDYGEYYIRLMYHLATRGYNFKELPYRLEFRAAGYSKTTTGVAGFLVKGARYLWTVVGLRFSSNA